MRWSKIAMVMLFAATICAAAVTSGVTALSRQTAVLKSLEHWTADWRTAVFADRAATQHPHLALVLIDDDTMQPYPCRSPIDRGLLARLIETLDAAGARVIALDFLFDQATEPDKDRLLAAAIGKAGSKVIVGTVDERVPLRAERREYLASFHRDAGAPTGYLNLRYEIDNVIRGEAEAVPPASPGARPADSFAVAIARAAGAKPSVPPARIAWLGKPADGADAFLTLPAAQLVAPANDMERKLAGILLAGIKDRVVLVGGDMSDQVDRHPTPMSKVSGGPMLGVLIHAHAVAQLLDGRRLSVLNSTWETAVVFLMALAGFLLGWRFRASGWLTSTLPIVLLVLFDAILFSGFRTMVPIAAPVLGWICAFAVARSSRGLIRLFAFWRSRPSRSIRPEVNAQ